MRYSYLQAMVKLIYVHLFTKLKSIVEFLKCKTRKTKPSGTKDYYYLLILDTPSFLCVTNKRKSIKKNSKEIRQLSFTL